MTETIWKRSIHGFWGAYPQSILNESIGFLAAEAISWDTYLSMYAYLGQRLELKIPVNSNFEGLGKYDLEALGMGLYLFTAIFEEGIGRRPTWEELLNHLAISCMLNGVDAIPEELGDKGKEPCNVCYICGAIGNVEDITCVNTDPTVLVHNSCLNVKEPVTIEIELDVEVVCDLAALSAKLNLSVNHLVNRCLRLCIREDERRKEWENATLRLEFLEK